MTASVLGEVFVAAALVHREHPEKSTFRQAEVIERAKQEGLQVPFRSGVQAYVSRHAVANVAPSPDRTRTLFAVGRERRLFRSGDEAHPERTGKVLPDRSELPMDYWYLLDWYRAEYDTDVHPPRTGNAGAARAAESSPTYGLDSAPNSGADGTSSAASLFEHTARRLLSEQMETTLRPSAVGRVPKIFDFVSPDRSIVGDAKYLTLVRGVAAPPAKFSVIAEHVWLLEKTGASRKFLVFGNDRRVPELWLDRFGGLVSGIEFLFLSADKIEKLN